jgi:exonuclease SbcC
MNFYAEYVENPENKIDLAIVAGDLTEESKMWADKALRNMNNVLYGWLKRLASRVPTVVISGTLNHDNLEMFNTLKLMGIPNLYVVTEPQLLTINFVNENNKGRVQVGCIPGYDKAHFRAANPGMNPEDENLFCSGLLGDIVLGLSTERDPKLAGVLVAHYTVIGAELDGNKNSVFTKSDVVLPSESIAASGFDLVCLGHIHKAQKVNNRVPVYYSGTLTGTSFNEEGQDKGFWVHSIDQYSSSDFVVTPYRAFKTIELDDWCQNKENLENMFNPLISYEAWFLHKNDILDIKDKIVRVKYTITDEQAMFFDRSKLEEVLYNFGAYYVQEIKPEKIIDSQPQQVIEMSEM